MCFLYAAAFAQITDSSVKTFEKDGLKFNYPSDWTITDKSTAEKQYLFLSKENATALIGIDAQRAHLSSFEQFRTIGTAAEKAYFKAVSDNLSTTYQQRVDREYLCLDLHGRNIIGVRLIGSYKNDPSRGEFYSFVLGDRFLTLSYLRTDKESTKTDSAWQELINSISLENSNKEASVSFFESGVVNEGYLNSMASDLGRPSYPQDARNERAQGSVLVEIEINEKGELLSAKAVSGNRRLWGSAESAVRKSKFKPTTGCGRPLRIKGTIFYNFIL